MNNNIPGAHSTHFRRLSKKQRYIYLISAVICLFLLLIVFINLFSHKSSTGNTVDLQQKIQLAKPVASQTIDRVFNFPITDANGKVVTQLKYHISTVEMRDEIIVGGQKVAPIAGKTFLVINLDVTNNYSKNVQINSRDYIRIIIDNSVERLAPDIHNDPVEVQAISTKSTRLALAIDTTVKNMVMQVGEINGAKTAIPLTVQYK